MKKPVMHSIWLVLVLSVLSSSVRAGTLGGLTYSISDGEVTITNCSQEPEGELVVPSEIEGFPVTTIGVSAFRRTNPLLTSVILPETLTTIGQSAFAYSLSLRSVTIPDSVHTIGLQAFQSCGVRSMRLPSSLRVIEQMAFQMARLESVVIPEGVVSIGHRAFADCPFLESVTIPSSVTTIVGEAFWRSWLASVTIPGTVTEIGVGAFDECPNLVAVTIEDGVSVIGFDAFAHCYELRSVRIPEEFTSGKNAIEIGGQNCLALYLDGNWGPNPSGLSAEHPLIPIQPSIRMAPVIMVQGEEGSVKTIDVADSPDGPWRFWMDVTATASGVAITDLDGQAHKRFYRVRD
ncbi:MAG: leucine-rich repeat domain-containing protein [Verrucomicrobiota bacterium]